MTIGTGTFIPNGQFWPFRPYVQHLIFFKNFGSVTHVQGRFTLLAPPPNPAQFVVQFDNDFWIWNSNKRSLNRIVTESWYKPNPGDAEIPMPFILSWNANILAPGQNLYFYPFGLGDDPVVFDLHPAPSDYWLPPPLP